MGVGGRDVCELSKKKMMKK